MWPGQGGTDWTALPQDASSSLQDLRVTSSEIPQPPCSQGLCPPLFSHMCVHPLVFLQSGRDRIIVTLNLFVLAAVTNRRKLGGLKQHIFFFSSSSRGQKSNTGLSELKSRYWQSVFFSRGSKGESVPCPFQILEAAHIPWLEDPSSIFKAENSRSSPPNVASLRPQWGRSPL